MFYKDAYSSLCPGEWVSQPQSSLWPPTHALAVWWNRHYACRVRRPSPMLPAVPHAQVENWQELREKGLWTGKY